MILLAIDQGTSSTKCIAFREDGTAVASCSSPLETIYTADGWAEQEPEAIYQSVLESVEGAVRALERSGVDATQVRGVGIAKQRETFVLWDSDGDPLYRAVVWQCKRSTGICEELSRSGAPPEIRARSGLIIDPYFSGTKASWLVQNDPRVGTAYRSGDAYFGTVDTWLLFRLTGGQVYATDMTNASRTLLFNIHERNWDPELAALLGLERLRLPAVMPSGARFGASDFDGCFPIPVPITALIGDSHAAFFGERCFTAGSAKATLGTGSSILLNAGHEAPDARPSTMSTIGFALSDRVDYALEGIIVSAGSILTWLERELGLFSDATTLEEIAESVSDAGGVTVVPGHAGLGAPFWRMDAKGSIHGLTFGTSRSHIVRGALESIPYQIRAILEAVDAESGVRCDSLRVDGGISRNGFVLRWLADSIGAPVHRLENPDVTALGAALVAGIGAGVYDGVAQIEALPLEATVQQPSENRDGAEQGYRAWRSVVELSSGCPATHQNHRIDTICSVPCCNPCYNWGCGKPCSRLQDSFNRGLDAR